VPQLLFLLFLCVLFINFYFSFFMSYVKEESLIDTDYLNASISVESEKEISSFDDMMLACIILIYIFG